MRHRPRGTPSTVDQDGPPPERLSSLSRRFSGGGAVSGIDPSELDFPSTEAVAALLAPRDPLPPLDSVTIRQWLWGRGFYSPGHAAHVLDLVQPLALEPAMTLLDAAAGLGGPARAIGEAFGVAVSALERDPDLARRGTEISAAFNAQKQALLRVLDPETFELRVGAFDRVLAREATYMVQDKERFLRVLVLALRPQGRLLMTDFVLEPAHGEPPPLAAWAALQPHRPTLWSLRQYCDCLRNLGLELRVPEDMSEAYKGQILAGWDNLLQTVDLRSLPRAHRTALVDELERWMRTVAALDSGSLRVYRFTALGGPALRR
jgi:SAM-dependent methyltransferase